MRNNLLVFCLFLLIIGCQSKEEKKQIKIVSKIPSNFQMYKTSEMAELMRTMLSENKKLRESIITGDSSGDCNKEFLEIHTAKFTDSSDFDATYLTFANHFIEMQKGIFNIEKVDRKDQFNKAVQACIACHKDRCTGPIPRIEKLLIP